MLHRYTFLVTDDLESQPLSFDSTCFVFSSKKMESSTTLFVPLVHSSLSFFPLFSFLFRVLINLWAIFFISFLFLRCRLECNGCSLSFDLQDRKPLSLACTHTICRKCSIDLCKNESVCCPSPDCAVPTSSSCMVVNLSITDLLLSPSSTKSTQFFCDSPFCSRSAEQHGAVVCCMTCDQNLCEPMLTKHKSSKKLAMHSILDLQKQVPSLFQSSCTPHKKPFSYYDKKCNIPICVDCLRKLFCLSPLPSPWYCLNFSSSHRSIAFPWSEANSFAGDCRRVTSSVGWNLSLLSNGSQLHRRLSNSIILWNRSSSRNQSTIHARNHQNLRWGGFLRIIILLLLLFCSFFFSSFSDYCESWWTSHFSSEQCWLSLPANSRRSSAVWSSPPDGCISPRKSRLSCWICSWVESRTSSAHGSSGSLQTERSPR